MDSFSFKVKYMQGFKSIGIDTFGNNPNLSTNISLPDKLKLLQDMKGEKINLIGIMYTVLYVYKSIISKDLIVVKVKKN